MRQTSRKITITLASLVIAACGSKGTETEANGAPESAVEHEHVAADETEAPTAAPDKPGAAAANDPLARALDHQNALLQIVADNKTNKAEAIAKLEAYVAANDADIKAVSAELAALKETEGADPARMALMIQTNTPRLQAMMALTETLMTEAVDVFGDPKVSELVRSVKGL